MAGCALGYAYRRVIRNLGDVHALPTPTQRKGNVADAANSVDSVPYSRFFFREISLGFGLFIPPDCGERIGLCHYKSGGSFGICYSTLRCRWVAVWTP